MGRVLKGIGKKLSYLITELRHFFKGARRGPKLRISYLDYSKEKGKVHFDVAYFHRANLDHSMTTLLRHRFHLSQNINCLVFFIFPCFDNVL